MVELRTVLVAVAVVAVAWLLLNATVFKKKSRFEPADFGDYAPAETYEDAAYDGEEAYGEPEAEAEYYEPGEAEYYEPGEAEYYQPEYNYDGGDDGGDEDEYSPEYDDDNGGEDDGEDDDEYAPEDDEEYAPEDDEDEEEYAPEEDETEDFTLMEPTIDDKYANALFTPPLI